jgi:arginase
VADVDLIGVPFDGYGRPAHQARAAAALRDAGLAAAFADHRMARRVDDLRGLAAPTSHRGAQTGLINEPALLTMTAALHDRVGAALRAGRFPVAYGGDCSTLLGIVTGLRDHADAAGLSFGLVFVDGHEDTMPLDVSEDGEAANAEIGLLLGLTGRLPSGPWATALPALRSEQLAVLGPRDEVWRRQFNVGSLRDLGIWLAPPATVAADPVAAGIGAVRHVGARRWWLHVDLDVLDPVEFRAQGLPDFPDEPGGLTWAELTSTLTAALTVGGCVGLSLAIYDPDQDPTGADAQRVVKLVTALAAVI